MLVKSEGVVERVRVDLNASGKTVAFLGMLEIDLLDSLMQRHVKPTVPEDQKDALESDRMAVRYEIDATIVITVALI